uniref:Ig-like domain-containing protein n=1 Tax=Sphaeramia orbicularis TaxID=375764 RepID=A0A673B4E3_9TELE
MHRHDDINWTDAKISYDTCEGWGLLSLAPLSSSVQIMEGSSVTLSCSSDANPPVTKYTWYKENEDSPSASGQNFTISDVRSEHSGNYYCEAQNSRGRQTSTLNLTVGASEHFSAITILLGIKPLLISLFVKMYAVWRLKSKHRYKVLLKSHNEIVVHCVTFSFFPFFWLNYYL